MAPFPTPCGNAPLPWEPVLSIKLLRLNREVLEAKYWMNLWIGRRKQNSGSQRLFGFVSKIHLFVFFPSKQRRSLPAGGRGGIPNPPYLVAVDAHMMGGDEGLEDDHPAGVGGALEQRVGHLGDVHVGGVGG